MTESLYLSEPFLKVLRKVGQKWIGLIEFKDKQSFFREWESENFFMWLILSARSSYAIKKA